MKVALADKPAVPFRVPPGIKLIRDRSPRPACAPGRASGGVILEAFKPGTAPPDNYSVIGVTDAGRPSARGVARGRSRACAPAAGCTERTFFFAPPRLRRSAGGQTCEVAARTANRWPSFPIHDVKQRSVVRSRGALLRPGFASSRRTRFAETLPVTRRRQTSARKRTGRFQPSATTTSAPPMRGGWSADRRTLSFGRACDARPPCPGATGTSLGAPPWRFSDADPRSRLPAVEPEPQRLPAPSINAWRSGSGPPAVRFAPQSWDATPRSVFRIVSGDAPPERECKSYIYKPVT